MPRKPTEKMAVEINRARGLMWHGSAWRDRDPKNIAAAALDINDAHEKAASDARSAIEWAVKCGEMLSIVKQALPRGEFDGWVSERCDFKRATAYAYIKVSKSSNTARRFTSIRQALGYESHKPKPSESLTGAPKAGAVESPPTPAPAAPVAPAPIPNPDGNYAGSMREPPVTASPTAEPEWTDADEAAAHEAAELDERERIAAAMAADDKLAEALRQIKQQAALLAAANLARNHAMRQAAEAVRLLKAEQRKVAKLERLLRGKEAA